MAEFGISSSSVIALSHNHPPDEYCPSGGLQGHQERIENAYPSDNDWVWAENAVANFNVPAAVFTLYITGCDGQTRAFPFELRAQFKADRAAKSQPPSPIAPTDCPEE